MTAQLGQSVIAARSHEELFSYWAGLRRGGKLPSRADVRPDGFKRLLPTVSLIDVRRDPVDYRVRLAGTGLYTVYGREITGRGLDEVYTPSAADYWRNELDKIVAEGRPGVGCHSLDWRGTGRASILWLRLPLASDGVNVDMILGYDAVVGMHSETSGIRAA